MKSSDLFGKDASPVYNLYRDRIKRMKPIGGQQLAHQKRKTSSWVEIELVWEGETSGNHTVNVLYDIRNLF